MSVEKVGRFAFGNRGFRPSDRARSGRAASRFNPTIAGALADLRGLSIGMAAAFAVLFFMRGSI